MTSNTTNLGASSPLPEGGKSLRIPIERTSSSQVRCLAAAARVERWVPVNLQLRGANEADAPAVATILIGTRAQFMPYAPPAHSDEEIRDWVRTQLIPGGGVTVAVHEGFVIGVAAAAVHDDGSWVKQMAVAPEYVGRGVGTRLLAHVLQALASPVRLYTFQANSGARRFYERNGFVAIALTDGRGNEERCPDVLYERHTPEQSGT